jgi:hypothetical protein
MRRVIPLLLIATVNSIGCWAQEVKLKKGKVLIDGVETFDYKVDMLLAETHVYHLGTKDGILLITYKNNGTQNYKGDDYITVFFDPVNTLFTTGIMYYGFRGEVMIKKLISERVLHGDGTIDPQRLETFMLKYSGY